MDSPRLILFGEDGNEEAQDEVERSDAVRLGTAGLSLAEPRRSDDWLRTLLSVSSSIAIDGQLSATPSAPSHRFATATATVALSPCTSYMYQ